MSLDDLEFELRKLPGVRAVGFEERPDVLLVQLHLAADHGRNDHEVPIPVSAARIASRLSDHTVAVEVVRWRNAPEFFGDDEIAVIYDDEKQPQQHEITSIGSAPALGAEPIEQVDVHAAVDERRPRLLAVLAFPDTDEIEVHLVYNGQRSIGRATASTGLHSPVEATIEAMIGLGLVSEVEIDWIRELDPDLSSGLLVAVGITVTDGGPLPCHGLAAGSTAVDAAARATLDALNRRVTRNGAS